MAAILNLKLVPNFLRYEWLCDAPGDVAVARTRQELIEDCTKAQLVAFKYALEQATTDAAWTALGNQLVSTIVPGGYARATLTAKFEAVDGVQRFMISGKSYGIGRAIIDVVTK